MKGKRFPGFLAGALCGMFGTVAVSAVHVIGKVGRQTLNVVPSRYWTPGVTLQNRAEACDTLNTFSIK